MGGLILSFLLLMLGISLDFSPDISYKQCKFSKTLLKKILKFVSNSRNGIVVFYLSFVLLLVEVDLILEKQSCKVDVLMACDTNGIKMVFVLLTKVVALYI